MSQKADLSVLSDLSVSVSALAPQCFAGAHARSNIPLLPFRAWGPTPTRSRSAPPLRGGSLRRLALAAGAINKKGRHLGG